MTDIEVLREVEEEWLADQLDRAIRNLGYPVGCGRGPHPEHLKSAARTLFDRYAKMINLAREAALTSNANDKAFLDEVLNEHETMRRTLEIIAANSADQLQATQARGALANIGPSVSLASRQS